MSSFFIFFKLCWNIVLSFFNFNYSVELIKPQEPIPAIGRELQKFEQEFTYPFSDTEHFRIEHGASGDYFAFFKSLGDPYFYVVRNKSERKVKKKVGANTVIVTYKKGEIAAAGCAILRTMKDKTGKPIKAWYLCDLKVAQKYQGEHIPLWLAQRAALPRFFQCPRGYGICMNPPNKDPKAARIFKNHGPISNLSTKTLNLYTTDKGQYLKHKDAIKKTLVTHGYMKASQELELTLTNGLKDYLIFKKDIQSSSVHNTRPWHLLHIQSSGKNGLQKISSEPQENAVHMICSVEGTNLDKALRRLLGQPSSTAQIVSYGMENVDFNCLSSNEI